MADQSQDAIHREMYRKSLDNIRVYNPTNADYIIEWDGFKHVVPHKNKDTGFGKGQRVLSRYLAEKYARDMKNQIINMESEERVKQMIEDAPLELKSKYQDDPFEKQKLYERVPRTDDPKKIKEIYDVLWMGVEEQYGLDQEVADTSDGKIDVRTVEERTLADLERPVKKQEIDTKYPITSNKKKLLEEVQA